MSDSSRPNSLTVAVRVAAVESKTLSAMGVITALLVGDPRFDVHPTRYEESPHCLLCGDSGLFVSDANTGAVSPCPCRDNGMRN